MPAVQPRRALLPVLVACSGGGGGGGSSPPPVTTPLAQTHVIDGQFAFGSLPPATTATLEYVDQTTSLPSGKTTTVRWVVQNDDRDLYLAFQWDDATHDDGIDLVSGPTDFDGVMVLFDVDGDGTWELGENACSLIAAGSGSLFVDQHAAAGDATDLVGDGTAWLTWDAGDTIARLEWEARELAKAAEGHDGRLAEAGRAWTR